MPNSRLALCSTLLAVAATTGCQKELCEKYYEQTKKCLPEMAEAFASKAEYVQHCRADEEEKEAVGGYTEEDQKARSSCLDMDECDKVAECMAEVTARVETRQKVFAIETAIGSDSLLAMQEQCDFVDTSNPEVVAACTEAVELLFADASERAKAAQASGEDAAQQCRDLERYVEVLGQAWAPKAKAVCDPD